LSSPIGANLYAYCANNSLINSDPTGCFALNAAVFASKYGLGLVGARLAAKLTTYILMIAPYLFWGIVAVVAVAVTAYLVYSAVQLAKKNKPVNLPSLKKLKIDMPHILSGHSSGGNRNNKGKKDVFWGMSATAIKRAVEESYSTCEKIQTQGERVLVRGFSKTYNIVVEMWVNVKDYIIETAYPKY